MYEIDLVLLFKYFYKPKSVVFLLLISFKSFSETSFYNFLLWTMLFIDFDLDSDLDLEPDIFLDDCSTVFDSSTNLLKGIPGPWFESNGLFIFLAVLEFLKLGVLSGSVGRLSSKSSSS